MNQYALLEGEKDFKTKNDATHEQCEMKLGHL